MTGSAARSGEAAAGAADTIAAGGAADGAVPPVAGRATGAVVLPQPWADDPFLQDERRWWSAEHVETAGDAMLLVRRAVERPERTNLVALGPAERLAGLLRGHDVSTHLFAWVDTAALGLLRPDEIARWGLTANRTGWEWLVSSTAPPEVAAEADVRELDPLGDADAIRACLAEANPTTDADPGRPGERWWGLARDSGLAGVIGAGPRAGRPGGRGSFHLHGLGVRPAERSRGLGAALTAAAVRSLLGDGADWVSLGMWDDNHGARRIYHRLGLRTVHRLKTLRRV